MRVNTTSCFLAIKHAARAMQVTSAAQGKDEGGGSIILTASGASCVVSCLRSHHLECATAFSGLSHPSTPWNRDARGILANQRSFVGGG